MINKKEQKKKELIREYKELPKTWYGIKKLNEPVVKFKGKLLYPDLGYFSSEEYILLCDIFDFIYQTFIIRNHLRNSKLSINKKEKELLFKKLPHVIDTFNKFFKEYETLSFPSSYEIYSYSYEFNPAFQKYLKPTLKKFYSDEAFYSDIDIRNEYSKKYEKLKLKAGGTSNHLWKKIKNKTHKDERDLAIEKKRKLNRLKQKEINEDE